MSPDAAILQVIGSLERKKGNVVVFDHQGGFMIVAGAPTAVKVRDGVIVSLGLTRERLVELKEQIDTLLEGS